MKFSSSHEWLEEVRDSLIRIGLTHYAQDELGEIVFVELPKPGAVLHAGDVLAVVESVKTASDIAIPIAGTVELVNHSLEQDPGIINRAAETEGWLVVLRPDAPVHWDQFMSQEEYQRYTPA